MAGAVEADERFLNRVLGVAERLSLALQIADDIPAQARDGSGLPRGLARRTREDAPSLGGGVPLGCRPGDQDTARARVQASCKVRSPCACRR